MIYLELLRLKSLDHSARIPDGYAVGGDILNNDASGSDGASFSDCHSGEDGDSSANPAVVPDIHWLRPLLSCVSLCRIRAVAGSVDAHVRPDEDIVTDRDHRLVKDNKVEIRKKTLPDLDVLPVVTMERRIDDGVGVRLSKYLPEFLIQGVAVGRPYLIVLPA